MTVLTRQHGRNPATSPPQGRSSRRRRPELSSWLEFLQRFSSLIICRVTLSSFSVYQEVMLSTVLQKIYSQSSLSKYPLFAHSRKQSSISAAVGPVSQEVYTPSIPSIRSHVPLLELLISLPARQLLKEERATSREIQTNLILVGILDFYSVSVSK